MNNQEEIVEMLNRTSTVFKPWKWLFQSNKPSPVSTGGASQTTDSLHVQAVDRPRIFEEKLQLKAVSITSSSVTDLIQYMLQVSGEEDVKAVQFSPALNFDVVHSVPVEELKEYLLVGKAYFCNIAVWSSTELVLFRPTRAQHTLHFFYNDGKFHPLISSTNKQSKFLQHLAAKGMSAKAPEYDSKLWSGEFENAYKATNDDQGKIKLIQTKGNDPFLSTFACKDCKQKVVLETSVYQQYFNNSGPPICDKCYIAARRAMSPVAAKLPSQ